MVFAADPRQRDARGLPRRTAEEEGVVEGAVLRERAGDPGLKVGAELADVDGGEAVLLEVTGSDGRAEEQEGLGTLESSFLDRGV